MIEERLPLDGWRVVLTRPWTGTTNGVKPYLERLGAEVAGIPLTTISWREDADERQASRDWQGYEAVVFTSANAVRGWMRWMTAESVVLDPGPVYYAIGPATANCAKSYGLQVVMDPKVRTGKELAESLAHSWEPRTKRVLFPHGQLASSAIVDILSAAGHSVTSVVVYDTVALPQKIDEWRAVVDGTTFVAVTLYSPSAVRALTGMQSVLRGGANVRFVGIGPTTARAIAAAGFAPYSMAATSSDEGVVEAIVQMAQRERVLNGTTHAPDRSR